MKLKSQYTVTCFKNCSFTHTGECEEDAISKLLEHVRQSHSKFYETLKKEGRKLAMSQNGSGYYDTGKGKSPLDGWHSARPYFREAWIENALKSRLNL